MPYSGRVCTSGNTANVKGPHPRVEPLRKTGRPPWRQETVKDVEKIFLLASHGTRLLRSC